MSGFGWIAMVGGLAFFFFGLSSARHGLQLAAGERLRLLMGRLTHNRFSAVGLGALITVILQSSSATTVILVSFAETGLLTLQQALGVVLGSGIGTTLVVILLSFEKVTNYALLIAAVGIAMELLGKRQRVRSIGQIVLGFGFIFFGMHLMSGAAVPLRESEVALHAFRFLGEHPFANLLFATIFTAIVQTSAATIGLAIALSYSGTLPFEAAVPIVLGANIGTCITAGLSSLGAGVAGKRVALAHVLIKVVGALIVYPFLDDVARGITALDAFVAGGAIATGGKIALTHLLFNIGLTLLFLPLIRPTAALVERMIPERREAEEHFGPKYLDETALRTPSLAFAQARREIMRVSKIAADMFAHVFDLFRSDEHFEGILEKVGSADDKIDLLEKRVRFYLAKVSQKSLTEEQAQTQVMLLTIGGELEDIGDIISKEIVTLAQKKHRKMSRFSDEGWSELKEMHALVVQNFDLMQSMLTQPHEDIAQKLFRHQQHLKDVELELRTSHLQRLHAMLPESYETSSIHLDLISQFRMINVKLARIVESLLEEPSFGGSS